MDESETKNVPFLKLCELNSSKNETTLESFRDVSPIGTGSTLKK